MADTQAQAKCASCKKTGDDMGKKLLHCSRCHTTAYCNRDCQKADWKAHKKICASQVNANAPGGATSSSSAAPGQTPLNTLKSLMGDISTKRALEAKKSEHEVYQVLIDSYRMRVEDECNFRGEIHEDSALGGGDPARGFRRYLQKAETREDVLPSWWSEAKREACVGFGGRRDHWWRLDSAVEKSDVQEFYEDGTMPMQLRMVAEEIVGSNVTGGGPGLP